MILKFFLISQVASVIQLTISSALGLLCKFKNKEKLHNTAPKKPSFDKDTSYAKRCSHVIAGLQLMKKLM